MAASFFDPAPALAPGLGWLRPVIWTKIAGTFVSGCLPLLLTPAASFPKSLGLPEPGPYVLAVRLLGWAWLALLVGYRGGISLVDAGKFPKHAVIMGLVSNGGAGLLITAILRGDAGGMSAKARGSYRVGSAFVLSIASALAAALAVQFRHEKLI
ncbi:hypothetical protein DFJ74DRAFT_705315 [Hyaloraphidium curvatum]|nr:hypothetical protein DFJ74DRAFT_705315 [Hyaloraphidium curvatum]